MTGMKKRLFVGVPVSAKFHSALVLLLSETKTSNIFQNASIRWTKPENLHITVCFLGFLDEKFIGDIARVVRAVASESEPFSLTFDRVGFAPPGKPVRMIWAVFQANSDFSLFVETICGSVERHLRQKTGQKVRSLLSQRATVAHVTLARIKGTFKPSTQELPQGKTPQFPMRISSCTLYESQTLPSGPRYSKLGTFHLKRP